MYVEYIIVVLCLLFLVFCFKKREPFAEGTFEPHNIDQILIPRKTPLIFPNTKIPTVKDPKKELENIWVLYRGVNPNFVN